MNLSAEVITPPARNDRGRVAFASIGCKANHEEMECLVSRLVDLGYRIVPFGQAADWTVVNTCTVTEEGDSDSRQAIRRARRVSPDGSVVVTGCLAQRDPEAMAALGGVSWLVGNAEKPHLAEWISEADDNSGADPVVLPSSPFELERATGARGARPRMFIGSDPTLTSFARFGAGREGRRTRATLKVQDGCDHHCTFCVIPVVRGRSVSRGLDETLREAELLVRSGYREIMLTGINSALWGQDLAEPIDLCVLLRRLVELPGLARIRLNSLEPQLVREEWLDLLASDPRFCRHLHLPLQSGTDELLRRMNRRYRREEYVRLLERVLARMPDCAIGADLLVGFPGESARLFEETYAFVESLPLAYLHVFSYSSRPGTAAAKMSAEVSQEERMERSARMRALGADIKRRFAARSLGRAESVLIEGRSSAGMWQGLTGNYLRTRFHCEQAAPGELRSVRLEELESNGMVRGRELRSLDPEAGTS